jgi:hypothetical protein
MALAEPPEKVGHVLALAPQHETFGSARFLVDFIVICAIQSRKYHLISLPKTTDQMALSLAVRKGIREAEKKSQEHLEKIKVRAHGAVNQRHGPVTNLFITVLII